jgi:very-short-patch-repair endonuclease
VELYSRNPDQPKGIIVHRSALSDSEVGRRDGIPVTTPLRTLLDLGAVVDEEDLEIALECALRQRLCSLRSLRKASGKTGKGRRGPRVLRQVLELRGDSPAAGSGLEVKLIRLLRSSSLAAPKRQFRVDVSSGKRFLDFAYPELMLGIEVGGRGSHSGPAAETYDSQRHNELTAQGWTIIYFSWDDVTRRPGYVLDAIRTVIRRRQLLFVQ